MKRKVNIIPGFDCITKPCGRNGCGKNPSDNHGMGSEWWEFVVISDDEDFAVHLSVGSGVYPRGEQRPIEARIISAHAGWPTTRVQVRDDVAKTSCSFVKGGCYDYYTSGLDADDFFKAHFVASAKIEQPESFWLALEARFVELRMKALADRADTKWERCMHCDATGTVAKKG